MQVEGPVLAGDTPHAVKMRQEEREAGSLQRAPICLESALGGVGWTGTAMPA